MKGFFSLIRVVKHEDRGPLLAAYWTRWPPEVQIMNLCLKLFHDFMERWSWLFSFYSVSINLITLTNQSFHHWPYKPVWAPGKWDCHFHALSLGGSCGSRSVSTPSALSYICFTDGVLSCCKSAVLPKAQQGQWQGNSAVFYAGCSQLVQWECC